MRWAEGPVYFPDGGYLLVSDIPNNRIMKFSEKDGSFTVFRSPANYANGNTRDRQGRLVTCEHSVTRRITRTEKDGRIDGARRALRRQAAERAERHRRQVRRQHLVHRSAVRHQRRMGRLARHAGAGDDQRLPHRQRRQGRGDDHRARQPERAGVLARREEALRRRVEGHAQPQHLELRRRRRRQLLATRPS